MKIEKDGKGQKYIEWFVGKGGGKRAWIQYREPDKDWANTPKRRYLNVARIEELGKGPAGNTTDFPIFNDMSDEQILKSFVFSVSSITGRELEGI